MNKNIYLNSVFPYSKPKKYSKLSNLSDKINLQNELQKRGLNIKLKDSLKGGFVSQVYSAILNGKNIVVKHTEDLSPFDPTEFFISKKGHIQDTKILKLLSKSKKIKVPKVLYFFPDIKTTIMEDVRENNYFLLNDIILNKKLTLDSASEIGKSLAHLSIELKNIKQFKTNESAEQSIYERGLELRLAYPNSQSEYLFLEKEFTKNNNYLVWPDGHPKNIFINEKGECMFIDFGRSTWGDQRYMLPNFLAHIVIYCLAGYIEKVLAVEYILRCIDTSKQIVPVDENIFCQYLAMEVLHRFNGKWIAGIETKEQKLAIYKFGLTVFDEKINSINKLVGLL